MLTTPAILLVTVILFGVLMSSRTVTNPTWRAMATPLASIIGSGFLVVGPLLAHLVGSWAIIAMTLLCAAGYLFGSVIRANIRHLEPLLAEGAAGRPILAMERVSETILMVGYLLSVTYYLNLFGAFLFRSADIVDPLYGRIAATVTLAFIGIVGLVRGLTGLERLELVSVSLKLAVIGGLLAGLMVTNMTWNGNPLDAWPKAHFDGVETVRIFFGLIVLVQGFETSRYIGVKYNADLRIKTMRRAQWLASAVYISFIALALVYLAPENGDALAAGSETAIMTQLSVMSLAVLPLLTLAALASQFSAAVADAGGSGGLLEELSGRRISDNWGYLLLCAAAIFVTWSADIYEIITYASRAFAGYYTVQAIEATVLTFRAEDYRRSAASAFAVLVGLALLGFGIPAETGAH